jgi:hypothetical protein
MADNPQTRNSDPLKQPPQVVPMPGKGSGGTALPPLARDPGSGKGK